jgi:hypothetical protein
MDNSSQNHEKDKHYELVGEQVRIFQRSGWWYVNFQHDGKQLRQALKTRSKKQARRLALKLEAEIMDGCYLRVAPPPPLPSVIEDYKKFLRTEGRRKQTLTKYDKVFERMLDLAGRRCVRAIDGIDLKFVDAYRNERVEAGAAPKTVYTESVVIRQLVDFALSRALIAVDPLKA